MNPKQHWIAMDDSDGDIITGIRNQRIEACLGEVYTEAIMVPTWRRAFVDFPTNRVAIKSPSS